jgi:hypothetical protein
MLQTELVASFRQHSSFSTGLRCKPITACQRVTVRARRGISWWIVGGECVVGAWCARALMLP